MIIKTEVEIDLIQPNKWNPNKQSDFIFKKAVESIKRFGFIDPVTVRSIDANKYEIVDGEHRYRAAKELGIHSIPVIDLGIISEQEAKALTIVLNNIEGEDDPLKRGELLKDLLETDLLELMPFSEDLIKEEIGLLDFNFDYDETGVANLEDDSKATFNFTVPIEKKYEIEAVLLDLDDDKDKAFIKLITHYQDTKNGV